MLNTYINLAQSSISPNVVQELIYLIEDEHEQAVLDILNEEGVKHEK